MRYRLLGTHTGLFLSRLALGAGLFGNSHGYGASPDDVKRMLESYAEAGGNVLDTSETYGLGESELLLGRFLADRRDDFALVSKYSRGDTAGAGLGRVGAHRKAMVQAVERSLRRLKTDRIDVYLVHMDDLVTPVEEIVRGLDDLVGAGKIVYGGFSNYPAWRIAAAAELARSRGWAPVTTVQLEYSLLERSAERELLPMAEGCGLGVMAWSPLGGGLLTGKYRRGERGRATDLKASVLHDHPERNEPLLDEVQAIAAELECTPSQVAIAWVLSRGVIPILGPRTPEQLQDNLGALQVRFQGDQLERLERVSRCPLGYPHELNHAEEQRAVMSGGRSQRLDMPAKAVL